MPIGNNKRNNDEDDDYGMIPQNKQKFMTIVEDNGRIEVYIRGRFTRPQEQTNELIMLNKLSSRYDTVVVHINSEGGDVALLTEIVTILNKFENIITIGDGDIGSAGATLWSIGHVRVVGDYCSVMYHREAYGLIGKTDQHLDYAIHNSKLYSRMLVELCGEILTTEEIEKAKTTEVHLTSDELISRGAAISYKQFLNGEELEPQFKTLLIIDDFTFIRNGDGTMTRIEEIQFGETYRECDVQYKIIPEELSETIEDAEEANDEPEVVEEEKPKKTRTKKLSTQKGEVNNE